MIEFGNEVKDKITGFKGVITGRCEYITGCVQCLVQPKCKKDGTRVEPVWFDEPRLVILKRSTITLEGKEEKPGFDMEAQLK